ncbi:hypothetical protein D3C72_2288530 [compost metagenome]
MKIDEAVPRSLAGNHEATIRLLPGAAGASARPTRKRRAKNAVTTRLTFEPPLNAWTNVSSDQQKILTA